MQQTMDSSRRVFLVECGVNTGMTWLYGRGMKNERVVDAVPDTRFHQTTILSSVRLDGPTVPCVFDGALNGELFLEYIRKFLVPTLRCGDIVAMDNLSSHRVSGIVEAIEAAGVKMMFLPSYSPDLNPIEMMWSKIKAILRKLKIRAKNLLVDAIASSLDQVSSSDAEGCFPHDAYQLL